MLTFAALFLLLGLGLLLLRPTLAGPLDRLERGYILFAPLPLVLTLLIPSLRFTASSHPWTGPHVIQAGVYLSLALTVGGVLLLLRRSRRKTAQDVRLLAALLVAAMPVLMVALVALAFAF